MISSRLSSLLVRDGVLGIKRMEQAFQRQVIYGGNLDTILLEMNAVPEERLWHYLSLATGLPAADRDLLEYFDPRAVQVCPRDVAERYHVAPCALDGPALRVLVIDPVDLGELEALATSLGIPVQPFVVPEYRFHGHLERLYGIVTPSRFSLLGRRHTYVPTPAGKRAEPSIVVDEGARDESEPRDTEPMAAQPEGGPAAPGSRKTVAISTDALQQQIAIEEARRREKTPSRPPPTAETPAQRLPAASDVVVGEPTGPTQRVTQPRVASVSAPPATAPSSGAPSVVTDFMTPPDGRGRAARGTIQSSAQAGPAPPQPLDKVIAEPQRNPTPVAGTGVVQAPWRGGNTLDAHPLTPRAAAELLGKAEDRDTIFGLLVRAARSVARYAGLLTVQGATAFGRVGIDGDSVDADINQVAVPLPSAPAMRGAFESRSPYIGPIATGLPEIDQMLALMGGVVPSSALILPVVIRDRTVALLYAHRGADQISIAEVAELLPVANDVAVALGRLIVKAKSGQGFARASTASVVEASPLDSAPISPAPAPAPPVLDDLTAKAPMTQTSGNWARPVPRPTPAPIIDFSQLPGAAAMPSPQVSSGPAPQAAGGPPPAAPPLAPPMGIGAVLDLVESGAEPAAGRAADEALARIDDLLPELGRRFPGQLAVDRYATSGRALRAPQHGPLLALCIRAGARVVPLLVEKLGSADREVRYYATLCLAEVRAPIAVAGLVGRLFDSDYGVRGAALEALLGYPPRDVDQALQPVRLALRSDALRARAAAHALGELRDVKSVLDLIDATERDASTATEAHRALVLITKQDFGTKAKKWRKWWEENRGKSRIEWMLDGLAHADEAVRLSASEELKRLTGEYFGYHHDGPKREREEARQRWLRWWDETGRARFTKPASGVPHAAGEDGRTTGMVPKR